MKRWCWLGEQYMRVFHALPAVRKKAQRLEWVGKKEGGFETGFTGKVD